MPAFPSAAWAKSFQKALNANPAFRSSAKDLTADFIFHIRPEGRLTKDQFLYVEVRKGECFTAEEISSRTARKAEFTIAGTYGEWVRLLRGEFDPVQAVLTRRIEVQGPFAKLMRHVPAAKELIRTSSEVQTTFV